MICFRDRTFCTYYHECIKGKTCSRALTPEVIKDAKRWWNYGVDSVAYEEDAPIAVFGKKPECFEWV